MINTVLFDLDGTIIDTNELIISSFVHVLEEYKLQPLTREQIIPHMGTTLEHQLQTFCGSQEVGQYMKAYRAYNDKHHDDMVQPFPQVMDVVDTLYQQGITLGVVTTKNRPGTIRVLELYGLKKYMSSIVTVADVEHPKPHPEPVLKALQELGAAPEHTLMVGDSPADLQAAHAAGVRSAAVAWSLKGEETLKKYNPDYILKSMTDLYSIVGQETSQS